MVRLALHDMFQSPFSPDVAARSDICMDWGVLRQIPGMEMGRMLYFFSCFMVH